MLDYKSVWHGSAAGGRDPARTSQTCSACWHWDPASHVSRDLFRCVRGAHATPADWNAARVVLGPEHMTTSWPVPENTGLGSACGAPAAALKQEPAPARGGATTWRERVRRLALQGDVSFAFTGRERRCVLARRRPG